MRRYEGDLGCLRFKHVARLSQEYVFAPRGRCPRNGKESRWLAAAVTL